MNQCSLIIKGSNIVWFRFDGGAGVFVLVGGTCDPVSLHCGHFDLS